MMANAKIGTALVGGYLLGRTKKAKVALGLGLFLAGKKLDLDPRRLARSVSGSPLLGGLSDQARTELVDATKSAAASALTRRAEGLADSLHARTLSLEGGGGRDGEDADGAEDGDDDPDGKADGDGERAESAASRRRAGSGTSGGTATSAKPKGKTGKTGKAGKAAGDGRRASSAGAARTRKTAGTAARRTASGTKRAASAEGGGNDG